MSFFFFFEASGIIATGYKTVIEGPRGGDPSGRGVTAFGDPLGSLLGPLNHISSGSSAGMLKMCRRSHGRLIIGLNVPERHPTPSRQGEARRFRAGAARVTFGFTQTWLTNDLIVKAGERGQVCAGVGVGIAQQPLCAG